MVKLKRMLGDIDDPTVVVLMALIESQSAETLANWSLNYVEQNLLSIYQDKYPDDARLKHIICETRKYLAGTKTKKEQRMLLKEAKAVSYTHLDVYKRQIYNSNNFSSINHF